jgi:hypothetical protein
LYAGEMRRKIRRSANVKRIAEGGTVGQELEATLDITTDVANANKPPQGVTRNRCDFPRELESGWKLFIGYQPREPVRPANSIHQGCEVWSDIRVEGRMIFVGIGVIILTAVWAIATGKMIRTLDVSQVDLVKVRV